jgi:protein-S-isoprenylcysteine O-methyltransferase Ste14
MEGASMLNMAVRSVLGLLAFALFLFVPAGTLDWPQAWAFLIIFSIASVAIGLWLAKTDPALLAARMASPLSADQRLSDRVIIAAIMILFFPWFAFMALDAKRFGWSQLPVWLQMVGAALIVLSFWGNVGVMRANGFAAVNVRVQSERGQTVADTGPYAVVRHPMYAWILPLLLGTPLLLGSAWGVLWLALFVPLLAARILGEEAVLRDGLAGYRDYAARVRYRLIPRVW